MRKSVVSILTWPLRFLRRLLALLARPFRKRDRPASETPGTPRRRIALKRPARPKTPQASQTSDAPPAPPARTRLLALKGRARIVALVILGVIVVVAVLALRPAPDEAKEVRATLDRYAQATREKDYQTLCDDLYASDLVQRIRSAGLPCEVALRTGLEDRQNPQLTVLGVEVSGDQALARARSTAVGEVASVDTIKLVKQDDGWRVASLSEPGAQLSGDAVP